MDPSPRGGQRVAFFGGSFDPPHLGHLAVARAARAALRLDTVLFAPVGAQPLKPKGAGASFADRLAMTRLAIDGESGFALSLADAPRDAGAPNYTLETLQKLRAELPPDGALFCLMGADSFAGLRNWHGGAELPYAASLIVASRPGWTLEELKTGLPRGLTLDGTPEFSAQEDELAVQEYLLRNRAGECARFYLLPGLHVDVSASAIRERARFSGEGSDGLEELLPRQVSAFIRSRGLYR